jgi:hypothetical protein
MSKKKLNVDKLGELRRLVLDEAIKASKDYMSKEKIREDLQHMVTERVLSGEIKDEASLKEFWKTVEMAMSALKMVPVQAFRGSR